MKGVKKPSLPLNPSIYWVINFSPSNTICLGHPVTKEGFCACAFFLCSALMEIVLLAVGIALINVSHCLGAAWK